MSFGFEDIPDQSGKVAVVTAWQRRGSVWRPLASWPVEELTW